MPIGIVQSQAIIAGVAHYPGAATLAAAFGSPVSPGNIILVYVAAVSGTRPSGVTDTLGNTYYEIAQPFNVGDNFSMWAALNIKGGANTVTVAGMSVTVHGGPCVIAAEIHPPLCPLGSVGIQGFNGPRTNAFPPGYTKFSATWNTSLGPFFSSIIFGLYDNADGGAATARTWTFAATLIPYQTGGVINQIQEDGGDNTAVLALSTVPYPHTYNECQLIATPSTPALHGNETNPYGCLISTVS